MALTRSYLKSIGIEGDKIDSIIEAHADTVEGLKTRISELQADTETFKEAQSERDKLRVDVDKLRSDLEKANGSVDQLKASVKEHDAVVKERDKLKIDLDKATKSIAEMQEKTANNDELLQERDSLKGEVDTLKEQIEQFTTKETESSEMLKGLEEKITALENEKSTAMAEADTVKTELNTFREQVETEKANASKRDAVRKALRNGGVLRTDFQNLIVNSMNLDDIVLDENGVKDVDQFIERTRSEYPSCFGETLEIGTPPIEPPAGNPPRPLSVAQIKKMSSEEINQNWTEVQKTLSKGV